MTISGSDPIQLTQSDPDHPSVNSEPSFSPNGNRIVFINNDGVGTAIETMKTDGSDRTAVRKDAPFAFPSHPSYAPDGRRMVFAAQVKRGGDWVHNVYTFNPDNGADLDKVNKGDTEAYEPAYSPDSRWIAFHRGDKLFKVAPDGSREAQLTAGGAYRVGAGRAPMQRVRARLTYPNVIATFCLVLLLGGGTAYAAGELGKESVGTKQLKKEAVTPAKLSKAVRSDLAGAAGKRAPLLTTLPGGETLRGTYDLRGTEKHLNQAVTFQLSLGSMTAAHFPAATDPVDCPGPSPIRRHGRGISASTSSSGATMRPSRSSLQKPRRSAGPGSSAPTSRSKTAAPTRRAPTAAGRSPHREGDHEAAAHRRSGDHRARLRAGHGARYGRARERLQPRLPAEERQHKTLTLIGASKVPARLCNGPHCVNTHHPMRFEGRPPDGSTLKPGGVDGWELEYLPGETSAILKYRIGDNDGIVEYTIKTSTFSNDSSCKVTPGAGKCSAGGLQMGFN